MQLWLSVILAVDEYAIVVQCYFAVDEYAIVTLVAMLAVFNVMMVVIIGFEGTAPVVAMLIYGEMSMVVDAVFETIITEITCGIN